MSVVEAIHLDAEKAILNGYWIVQSHWHSLAYRYGKRRSET
jgi:hypothetical protein